MAKLEVKLIGSGKDGDPFRVDLPTYTMLDVDYVGKRALVDVSDEAFPSDLVTELKAVNFDKVADAEVVVLTETAKARIEDYVTLTYREGFKAWNADKIDPTK